MENKGVILQLGQAPCLGASLLEQFHLVAIEEQVLTEEAVLELRPDLILLCVGQAAQAALALLSKLQAWTSRAAIPVCVLDFTGAAALEARALQGGAVDFLAAPFDDEVLLWRLRRAVNAYRQYRALQQEAVNKEKEMERLSMQALAAIANLLDAKACCRRGHSVRVAAYASAIAEKLHKSEKERQRLSCMGLLHELGESDIPDTVLTKAGQLTDSEYSPVKQPTLAGKEPPEAFTGVPHASVAAGYPPAGPREAEMPLDEQIITIADAYDTMNTHSSYRSRFSREQIRQELEKGRGVQFPWQLVDIVLELMEEHYEPQKSKQLADFTISTPIGEGNGLLQRLLWDYTEQIKDISYKDALTGLWNRGYMEKQLYAFLHTGCHAGTFMMLDLDNFKTINDTYGHLAGDQLLIQFGAILRRLSREKDIVCRFGGDEFAVFLKDLNDAAVVQRKAELYSRRLWETLLEPQGYSTASVSIGIAMAPQQGNSFLELYQKADKALYSVKQNGKNGYRFYETALEEQRKQPLSFPSDI